MGSCCSRQKKSRTGKVIYEYNKVPDSFQSPDSEEKSGQQRNIQHISERDGKLTPATLQYILYSSSLLELI